MSLGPPHPNAAASNFARFFEQWLQQQHQDLTCLRSAPDDDQRLRPLVDRILSHYESYYSHKTASARRDVLPMFSPSWTSSTENLFLWVGGWRPSVAIHLLYSKSGLQLEPNLSRLIAGLTTSDLSDLSPAQLDRIDGLQRETIRREKEISEEEAEVQETVADAEMVMLAEGGLGGDDEAMGRAMKRKEEGMGRVLERADRLRMETLRGVVEILRPCQAVHFLTAAAELHLRVHDFGKRKDDLIRAPAPAPAPAPVG